MPVQIEGASDFFNRKQDLPSELRTAESAMLSAYVKERAFFMASVTNADVLQANRDAVNKVLSGEMTMSQARYHLEDIYAQRQLPVEPLPGLEGTIKDLRTTKRMEATIKTNVAMARGWERARAYSGNPAFPAWELVRSGRANEPRDWQSRWDALAPRFEDAHKQKMIALASSGIWTALSRFGTPHPPFDWGSHMTISPVDLEECVRLGLLPDPDTQEGEQAVRESVTDKQESLNASVQKDTNHWDKSVLEDVQKNLGGLAEYDAASHTIRMKDINGTRPYKWDELADIIDPKVLPDGVPTLQKEAWEQWITDSSYYHTKASLDERENMARALQRMLPVSSKEWGKPIYRTLTFSNEKKYLDVLKTIEEGGFSELDGRVGGSWSDNPHNVERYASKRYSIVLECDEYESARPIHGIYKNLVPDKQIGAKPLDVEAELIMPSDVVFNAKNPKTSVTDGVVRTVFNVREQGRKGAQ